MKISVLGTGRWASTNIWIAVRGGHDVMCWDKFETDFMKSKKNRYVDLSDSNKVICNKNLEETLNYGEIVIISILAAIYAFISYFTGHVVAGWTSLILSIWFFGGLQLLALGLVGQYIGKIYMEVKHRPRYNIEKILSTEDDKED